MMSVDQTIVSTALPAIQSDLGTALGWAVWTITVYSLGQVLAKPMVGRLTDRLSAKRVFLVSVTVFTLASACCGLAPNVQLLIAMRFVQALGGGVVLPAGAVIISAAFGENRDRALGLFSSIVPIGALIGPVLGGLLVHAWSWRGIFLVNVPIGLGILAAAAAQMPRTSSVRTAGTTDFAGVFLLSGLILTAMIGITELGDSGEVAIVLPCLAAAAACAFVLRGHLRRHENPVISPALLTGSGFGAMNVLNFLYGCTTMGLATLVPLYAERRYSIPPLEAGTLLTARAIGIILLSGATTFALRRTGYRLPMLGGSLLIATGLALMAIPTSLPPTLWLAITAAIAGLGMGVAGPASNNAAIYLAPDQIAEITGLRGTFRQAGSITAVSVATAVSERSGDPGKTLGLVFVAFAVLVVSTLPLLFRVTDHRGTW
ncbi:multidrug efflux MFS transporter [Amycolatopsis acidicola]|uniref:Multidrug efflux MFS transporter n=2 Tax=Amycolatopsis acidicola TaxID=2596893 RepID=A0A5N0UX00_9PSEU|nr:multidrug efflux MFS transporter [Amycolatopsis acidicola]